MKTLIFLDTRTRLVKTFSELKEEYIKEKGSVMSLSDDIMLSIIDDRLVQNGGSLALADSKILNWCNEYVDYLQEGSELSRDEHDRRVKDVFESVCLKGDSVKVVKDIRLDDEGKVLLTRLEDIMWERNSSVGLQG